MSKSIDSPIVEDVAPETRREYQEHFGRHLVETRDRMAEVVLTRLFGNANHPIPIIDRKLEPIRNLNQEEQAAVKAAVLDASDQIVSAILTIFARGNETAVNGSMVVNYAIVAQQRAFDRDDVLQQVDINRGEPYVVAFDQYKKWLSRYSKSDLRP